MVGGWSGWSLVGITLVASACSPGEADTPDEEISYDYEACDDELRQPSCVGLDCADDAVAGDALDLLLQTVADRGYADAFTPVWARSVSGSSQLLVDYQLQVDWMRTADRLDIELPETAAELRAELEDRIDDWTIPERLVEPADIVEAVEGCDARLEIDPCTDFGEDFVVRASREEELTGCLVRYVNVTVDARTAGVSACGADEQCP